MSWWSLSIRHDRSGLQNSKWLHSWNVKYSTHCPLQMHFTVPARQNFLERVDVGIVFSHHQRRTQWMQQQNCTFYVVDHARNLLFFTTSFSEKYFFTSAFVANHLLTALVKNGWIRCEWAAWFPLRDWVAQCHLGILIIGRQRCLIARKRGSYVFVEAGRNRSRRERTARGSRRSSTRSCGRAGRWTHHRRCWRQSVREDDSVLGFRMPSQVHLPLEGSAALLTGKWFEARVLPAVGDQVGGLGERLATFSAHIWLLSWNNKERKQLIKLQLSESVAETPFPSWVLRSRMCREWKKRKQTNHPSVCGEKNSAKGEEKMMRFFFGLSKTARGVASDWS